MRWTLLVLGVLWAAPAIGLAQGPAGPIRQKPRPTQTPRVSSPPAPQIGQQPDGDDRHTADYQPPSDLVLSMAIEANKEFDQSLPNFLCNQLMTRASSRNLGKRWKDEDLVEAEVLIVDGREDYRDIKIDGQPTGVADLSQIGGAWSMGEYSAIATNLFAPSSGAQFSEEGADTVGGRAARVYSYKIEQQNSRWMLNVDGRKYAPGYHGRVWIDPTDGRALRVEMEATYLPHDYPLITVESALQYDDTAIDGKSYLLPAMAENTGCVRGSAVCWRLHIDFRDYRKFSSESSVFTTDSDIDFGRQVPEEREPQK
jgi:hypothetical protein